MKLTRKFCFLLAPVLSASVVFAQTRDEGATSTSSGSDQVSAARTQYTRTTGISPDANPDAKDDNTLAQFPRARPGMPFPPPGGYPRGSYQTQWMDHGSAGHVLIGAAIGFGIGAALGARSSAQNGTPVSGGILIGGGIFGFIGGCVGAAVGSFHGGPYPFAHRRPYRPSSPRDDDEESQLRTPSTRDRRERPLAAQPASPSQAATIETTAQEDLARTSDHAGTPTAAIRISQ
jgi:hypothetical protein